MPITVITQPGGTSNVATLDDLTDVNTTTVPPSSGQILAYNGTEWRPTDQQVIPDTIKPNLTIKRLYSNTIYNGYANISSNNVTIANRESNDTDTGWSSWITNITALNLQRRCVIRVQHATDNTIFYNSLVDYIFVGTSSPYFIRFYCLANETVSQGTFGGEYPLIINFVLLPSITLSASLTDVVLSSVANKNLLSYNSTTSKWNNSVATLANTLSDVVLSGVANKNLLSYNSTTSKWNNSVPTLANTLTDVVLTYPVLLGHQLKFDGTNWINSAPSTTTLIPNNGLSVWQWTTIGSGVFLQGRLHQKASVLENNILHINRKDMSGVDYRYIGFIDTMVMNFRIIRAVPHPLGPGLSPEIMFRGNITVTAYETSDLSTDAIKVTYDGPIYLNSYFGFGTMTDGDYLVIDYKF